MLKKDKVQQKTKQVCSYKAQKHAKWQSTTESWTPNGSR